MKAEIIKVTSTNPEEFGLEVKKGNEIEKGFSVNDVEIGGLTEVYNLLSKSEISEENVEKWNRLSIDLSSANGALKRTHTAQKSYFLNGGRFADACKNIRSEMISQMQVTATANKKYFENLKLAEIAKTKAQRELEITPLLQEMDTIPDLIGEWDETIYSNYLAGAKLAYNARIEEAKKIELARLDAEKIVKLSAERKFKTSRLINYIDNYDAIEFGKLSGEDFKAICDKAIKARTDAEAEQERIRLENEALKMKAEQDKIKADKALKLEQDKLIAIKAKADAEAEKLAAKGEKERLASEMALKLEREKQAKLQAELKAKADAEAKVLADLEAKKQAELSKGDEAKLKDLNKDLEDLKTKYEFESKANQALYAKVGAYLDKLITNINN